MSGHDETLREELSALLDGALSAEREAELRALLERDGELRAEYEALRETVALVRGLPREKAPTELAARLRAARPRGLAPLLRIAVPLAAAAVVLVAFVLNLQQTQPVDSTEMAKDRTVETRKAAEPPAGERDRYTEAEEPSRALDRARETKKEIGDDKSEALEEAAPVVETRAGLAGYLGRLEALDTPALRSHIASFAQEAAEARRSSLELAESAAPATEAGEGTAAADEADSEIQVAPYASVTVAGKADARRVEALLRRAYAATPADSLGKPRRGAAKDGGKAGRAQGAAPTPRPPADAIRLELEVTPEELAQIEAWLARVSVTATPTGLAGTAATVVSGAVARRRLRVEIRVLTPPAPTAPAAAERESNR